MTARRRVHPLIRELADQRRALDFTRREAARLAGIAPSTIAALETGQAAPRIAVLEDLAHALGYKVALIRIDEKQCRACEEVKPLRYFRRDTRTSDGFANHCGPCSAAGATDVTLATPGLPADIADITVFGRDRGRMVGRRVIAARRDRRIAQFAELRRDGLPVAAAAEQLGLSTRTGERYERQIKQEAAA
jgi:DNA-binding XRE family transcriptional regulator